MIVEVSQKVQQPMHDQAFFPKMVVSGEAFLQIGFGQISQNPLHDLAGFAQIREDFAAWHVSSRKFKVAHSDVARAAEQGTDEMLEIASNVQAEVARRVFDVARR